MSNQEKPYHERKIREWNPRLLAVLGVLSVLLSWLPWVAPLLQAVTLAQSIRAARWGVAEGWSLALGVGGHCWASLCFLCGTLWAFPSSTPQGWTRCLSEPSVSRILFPPLVARRRATGRAEQRRPDRRGGAVCSRETGMRPIF